MSISRTGSDPEAGSDTNVGYTIKQHHICINGCLYYFTLRVVDRRLTSLYAAEVVPEERLGSRHAGREESPYGKPLRVHNLNLLLGVVEL